MDAGKRRTFTACYTEWGGAGGGPEGAGLAPTELVREIDRAGRRGRMLSRMRGWVGRCAALVGFFIPSLIPGDYSLRGGAWCVGWN